MSTGRDDDHGLLSVIQPVPHHDGAYELTLPLLVAPRFVPDNSSSPALPAAALDGLPVLVPVDIDVDVHTAVPLLRAESPTHTIDLAVDGDGLAASLYGVLPDRDFVLRWWDAGDTPQIGLLTHGDYALLTLEPPREAPFEDRVPRELIWIAAVGIGDSPNRYLLGELARLGGGVATYTTLKEDPEAALDRLVAAMDRPVLTDIVIDWGEARVDSVFPSRVPDLHVGTPLFVSVHSDGPLGTVQVTGRMGDRTFLAVVEPEAVADGRPLETSWARAKVADIHRQTLRGELTDEEPAITAVGLSAHILTDYTSFVAVEQSGGSEAGGAEADVVPIYSREFLARIPAGRSYQSAVGMAGGVTGTFSLNFNFDAIEQLSDEPARDGALRFVASGAPLLVAPSGGPSAGNRLGADVEVRGGSDGAGLTLASVEGGVGGHVVLDRAWLAARVGSRWDWDRGLAVDHQVLSVHGTVQPSSQFRLEVRGDAGRMHAAPTNVSGSASADDYGRWDGSVVLHDYFGKVATGSVWLSGMGQTVRGDLRRGGSVGLDVDRTWAARWVGELHARYAFVPWTSPELLSDPRTAYVPGLVDPWRPLAVDGRVAWLLPTDPWTFTIAVDGAWASAAPGDGWWLEDQPPLQVWAALRWER